MKISDELFSALESAGFPFSQEGYFKAAHLEGLFHSKIAKSQATGKDGVRIGKFADDLRSETDLIERKVFAETYEFTTYKERLLLRGADRQPRQISIPTVRDRLTLRALCEVLHTYVPSTLGVTPHALVNRVFRIIESQQLSDKVFVRVDVKNFFPSIPHKKLERELAYANLRPIPFRLCLEAVRTPTGSSKEPNLRGVPQGLSISGALAALYMARFDRLQLEINPEYFRYVDDILAICNSDDARSYLEQMSKRLNARGLTAHKLGSPGKTEIKPIAEGIDFLGYRISTETISIRDSSYKRMFRNLLKIITDYKYRNRSERLLFKLNLKISGCVVDGKRRGWMMFFAQTRNTSQLSFLDKFVREQLERVGLPPADRKKVKTFIKSYHEIRYNISETSYVPNFDNYSKDQKLEVIAALSSNSLGSMSTWNIEYIDEKFSKLISKEVHDLEQDVGNPS